LGSGGPQQADDSGVKSRIATTQVTVLARKSPYWARNCITVWNSGKADGVRALRQVRAFSHGLGADGNVAQRKK
jgi:hypothetical protein